MEQLLCIVEKDTLILPPTFSRLPPDGDEFPPNFSEPITVIAEIMNDTSKLPPPPLPKSIPPKTAPRKIYRKDFVIEVSDKRGNCDATTLNSNNNNKNNMINLTNNYNTKETIIQLDGDGGGNVGVGSGGNTPKIIEDKAIRKIMSKKSTSASVNVSSLTTNSNELSSSSPNQISSSSNILTTDTLLSMSTPSKSLSSFSTSKSPAPRKSLIATNWRKDEKSEKSVRDKIAMFSNGDGNNNCQQTSTTALSMSTMSLSSPSSVSSLSSPTTSTINVANCNNNSTVKRIPIIAKSTENLNWNNVRRQSEENLYISQKMRQKALSVENLDRPDEITHEEINAKTQIPETSYINSTFSTSDLTSGNLYNSLPRKHIGTGSHPSLTRATSFTGYNTLNATPYDEQRKSKINNLLERRKKSISKLRGLVIPEKPTVTDENLEPTCLDLPEIKSKELERIKENNYKNKTKLNGNKNNGNVPHWTVKKSIFSVGDTNIPKEYKQIFSTKRDSPVIQTAPAKPPRNSLTTPIKPINNSTDSVSASTDSDDSDSVFSSKISSPPLSPEKYPLTRTLSSETNTSIASSNTSTLTSGSGSQASCSSMGSTPTVDMSRRVQKSESINNRRNILVSARCRSGRDEGSLLARQKSLNDDDSTDGGDDADYNRTPKPKKRNFTNYKLATNDDIINKNINIATYVEVVSENENVPIINDNSNQMTDLSNWVRQEVIKVQPMQRSINTTVPKLSTAEIRKAFEAKTITQTLPIVTTPTQMTTNETVLASLPPTPTQSSQIPYSKEIETHHDRISSWDSISSYSDIVTTSSSARKSRPSLSNVTIPPNNSKVETHLNTENMQKNSSASTIISREEINQFIQDAYPPLEKPEAFVVTLVRESLESSIGITLAGGSDYESKEITIHRILKNSPADKDGQLLRGDRILAINNESMKNLTHGESVTVLKVN